MVYSCRGDNMPKQNGGNFDQKQYMKDYYKEHVKWRKVSFNDTVPEDVVLREWIDGQQESTSAYIKRLVRQDMEARSN